MQSSVPRYSFERLDFPAENRRKRCCRADPRSLLAIKLGEQRLRIGWNFVMMHFVYMVAQELIWLYACLNAERCSTRGKIFFAACFSYQIAQLIGLISLYKSKNHFRMSLLVLSVQVNNYAQGFSSAKCTTEKCNVINFSLGIYCLVTSFIVSLFINNRKFIKYYLPIDATLNCFLVYKLIFGLGDEFAALGNILLTLPFCVGLLILIYILMRLTNILVAERE